MNKEYNKDKLNKINSFLSIQYLPEELFVYIDKLYVVANRYLNSEKKLRLLDKIAEMQEEIDKINDEIEVLGIKE